ncbi:MAG: sugar ABC transporter ATP-binding protein [Tenericutes bacterium GWC2_34_14]|nr:MAG: sugar ABC transporter ATP-binding protein [Tenericutes bacterium GWA2_35_7]OHE29432.1 MAG: sugar ABC transporter ATP-binding protein [Tenericutes bacterium GWC2_34_14]OHE34528.1 MAG: sugar ABC transporter ATP-binding protein [Tenericutes bacterium GWE2_34_108]OHE35885.1 MAG: sugar ABC transporter ATP-binding protein [Tenericutes bacterium GWF1_35_14]OHE39029.1 MAG: sugar ABC transporter ATP-binding protein [Tenericutes bacterium GWF2_35_184]OHE42904.1 MAG: sugar ABC transporter ATP-bin
MTDAIRKPWLNKKQKDLIKKILLHSLLIFLSFGFMFPFLWMLFTALKTPAELLMGTEQFFPKDPQWQNFVTAVQAIPFLMYLKNSLFIVMMVMTGTLFSATTAAYAFAKLNWRGRDKWFIIMLSTMMIPIQVILIPTYIMYAKIGWLGTRLPLIVPAFFGGGSAFYIFLLRQFFKGIPKELSESAIIDGANHFQIFLKIMLPLCKPAIITVALFTFMGTWNDYFGPLIFLSNPDHWTLALGLRAFQMQYGGRFDLMMAAAILIMLPSLIIFFFTQKSFIEGITFTGIKG